MPCNIIGISKVYQKSKFTFEHTEITVTSQVPQKYQKWPKDSVTVFVSLGGSSSAARLFIIDTQKLGLVLVSPGGHAGPARRFLEQFQKPDFISNFQVNCHPNAAYITIQSIINHNHIKHTIGTPLTWIFLLNLLNVLLPSCFPISFLFFHQFKPRTSPNTHKHSPFVLYSWYSLNLAKTFPNTHLLPFKPCLNLGQ